MRDIHPQIGLSLPRRNIQNKSYSQINPDIKFENWIFGGANKMWNKTLPEAQRTQGIDSLT